MQGPKHHLDGSPDHLHRLTRFYCPPASLRGQDSRPPSQKIEHTSTSNPEKPTRIYPIRLVSTPTNRLWGLALRISPKSDSFESIFLWNYIWGTSTGLLWLLCRAIWPPSKTSSILQAEQRRILPLGQHLQSRHTLAERKLLPPKLLQLDDAFQGLPNQIPKSKDYFSDLPQTAIHVWSLPLPLHSQIPWRQGKQSKKSHIGRSVYYRGLPNWFRLTHSRRQEKNRIPHSLPTSDIVRKRLQWDDVRHFISNQQSIGGRRIARTHRVVALESKSPEKPSLLFAS